MIGFLNFGLSLKKGICYCVQILGIGIVIFCACWQGSITKVMFAATAGICYCVQILGIGIIHIFNSHSIRRRFHFFIPAKSAAHVLSLFVVEIGIEKGI